jgi:hypothetical protein
MILLDPEVIGPSIAKSHVSSCGGHSKRLLLAYKSWMLLVMSLVAVLIRMPEAYAVNVTVKSTMVSMTSYHATEVLPTGDIVSLMKGNKPIVIPENEVITSVDSEDYLEEDSEEDYESELKKENASGESARHLSLQSVSHMYVVIISVITQATVSSWAVAVSSHATSVCITCSAIRSQTNANARKIIL